MNKKIRKIRTKDVVKTIRTFNRSEEAVKKVGRAVVRTRDAVEKSVVSSWETPEEYTEDKLKTGLDKAVQAEKRTAAMTKKAAMRSIAMARKAAGRTGKSTAATGKGIVSAVRKAAAVRSVGTIATATGGGILTIVILICFVGLMVSSPFGIFYSGEKQPQGKSMSEVIREINTDYQSRLEEVKAAYPHDNVEMSGSTAAWRDVLAIFAVKTANDVDQPGSAAVLDEEKIRLLKNIFWEMNQIGAETVTKDVVTVIETDEGKGNIVTKEVKEKKTTLLIHVTHKTADQMAAQYGFDIIQQGQLVELLDEKNGSLWFGVQYGAEYSNIRIVGIAASQIGNVGGEPYWSWYGFKNHVEWCACFVSWCADQCGYIENGVIPKYAGCGTGVKCFKDRGQWLDGSQEPAPGMIIFFDWDESDGSNGAQDGESDHTGIVEKVENGYVYTIEGNAGNSVKEKRYLVGYYEILGYGVPAY